MTRRVVRSVFLGKHKVVDTSSSRHIIRAIRRLSLASISMFCVLVLLIPAVAFVVTYKEKTDEPGSKAEIIKESKSEDVKVSKPGEPIDAIPFWLPVQVFGFGALGVVVGVKSRISRLSPQEVRLLSTSAWYAVLAPITGGILALTLYLIFFCELLKGPIFPTINHPNVEWRSIRTLFTQTPATYKDYALLLLWSFIAGYSERFVTGVLDRFESTAERGAAKSKTD